MAKTKAATWRLEDSHPPMKMVDFRPAMIEVTAQLMLAARVTCSESWHVGVIAGQIERFLIDQLRQQAKGHRLDFEGYVKTEANDD